MLSTNTDLLLQALATKAKALMKDYVDHQNWNACQWVSKWRRQRGTYIAPATPADARESHTEHFTRGAMGGPYRRKAS